MVTKSRIKKCSRPGCDKKVFCRGFCRNCYARLWRRGFDAELAFPNKKSRSTKDKIKNLQLKERIEGIEEDIKRTRVAYRNCTNWVSSLRIRHELDQLYIQLENFHKSTKMTKNR